MRIAVFAFRGFEIQQPFFPRQSAGETSNLTPFGHHAVAWHEQGQGIGTACVADGAGRPGHAQSPGDGAVAACPAEWNLSDLAPDALLKIGSGDIRRQFAGIADFGVEKPAQEARHGFGFAGNPAAKLEAAGPRRAPGKAQVPNRTAGDGRLPAPKRRIDDQMVGFQLAYLQNFAAIHVNASSAAMIRTTARFRLRRY